MKDLDNIKVKWDIGMGKKEYTIAQLISFYNINNKVVYSLAKTLNDQEKFKSLFLSLLQAINAKADNTKLDNDYLTFLYMAFRLDETIQKRIRKKNSITVKNIDLKLLFLNSLDKLNDATNLPLLDDYLNDLEIDSEIEFNYNSYAQFKRKLESGKLSKNENEIIYNELKKNLKNEINLDLGHQYHKER